jgi:hypothetical protein
VAGRGGQVVGKGADLDRLPRHQSSYRRPYQRIGMIRAAEGLQEVPWRRRSAATGPGAAATASPSRSAVLPHNSSRYTRSSTRSSRRDVSRATG